MRGMFLCAFLEYSNTNWMPTYSPSRNIMLCFLDCELWKWHCKWSHSSSVMGSKPLVRHQRCEKVMGWCTAQCKMLPFCAKTIMKESHNFEGFGRPVTFCFNTFTTLFCTTLFCMLFVMIALEHERYVVITAYKILRHSFVPSYIACPLYHYRVYWLYVSIISHKKTEFRTVFKMSKEMKVSLPSRMPWMYSAQIWSSVYNQS